VPVARLASDEARRRGRVVFREHCALCHGERADGRGIRQEALSAKPIDFSRRAWREQADPIEIHHVLVEGKRGTSMPAWPTLSEEEKWDVIAYVLRVSRDGP
jgi:mono/diheme cytochrome c family protein